MNNFFTRIRYKFSRFMTGRYGADEFSSFLLKTAIVFWLLSIFIFRRTFSALYWLFIVYAFFRIFSKNIPARSAEREKFLRINYKYRVFFNQCKNRFRNRKTHKYYRCKNCKTLLRVPRGKGKIDITCKVCNTHMIKKT